MSDLPLRRTYGGFSPNHQKVSNVGFYRKVGIMRLHPVEDGIIPEPHERGVKKYDQSGQLLRDVIDPTTGFCVRVTSPLINDTGMSVFSGSPVKGGRGEDIRWDPNCERYVQLVRKDREAPIGIVERLTTDGDELLPVSRVRIYQATPSHDRKAEREYSAPVQKSGLTRKQNDDAVKAVLSAMGYKGEITRELRKAVLDLIVKEREFPGAGEEVVQKVVKRLGRPKKSKKGKNGR